MHAIVSSAWVLAAGLIATSTWGDSASAPSSGSHPTPGAKPAQACLISDKGIGAASLGMSVREVRVAMPHSSFRIQRDGEGVPWIVVTQGGRERMKIYAEGAVQGKSIRLDRPIREIETRDPGCATASGVHPGMRLSAAAERLGGLVALSVSEIESREFAQFGKQASSWLFRTDGGGIYAPGQRVTTNHAPQTVLLSVSVHD